MLALPLSLWLTFSPVYLTSMGSGSEFGAIMSYQVTKRASWDFEAGVTTATQFRDRHGSLDLTYSLIKDRLDVATGVGYEQYDLYGVDPTITKDLHCRVKVKVF